MVTEVTVDGLRFRVCVILVRDNVQYELYS
eukprot:COSAG01_NODE_1490_length_10131_cov_15.364135_1_plen_30_part_00